MSETPAPNQNGAPVARKYEHNQVVSATIDGEPNVRAVRVQEASGYGFWLANTGKPGPMTRFDREVTDIEPLVSFTIADIDALIDAINLGETQLAVDTLKEAADKAVPPVIEPTGLGAVVVDVWGEQFVRVPEADEDPLPWLSVNGYYVGWADIVDPTIESTGATAPVEPTPPPTEEPVITVEEPTPA